jgi:hypothetical protein
MAVDELLSPPDEILSSESWLRSRMRICAVGEIIKRLDQLEQPGLVSEVLNSLKSYLEILEKRG